MKIIIHAKPMAREDRIEKNEDGSLTVWTTEPPINGKANRAITKLLAEYLHVALFQVRLISGFSSRQKVFQVIS